MTVLRVLVIPDPDRRRIYKLLRRWEGRILAVAIVVEGDNPQQLGNIIKHYGATVTNLPPELLLIKVPRGRAQG